MAVAKGTAKWCKLQEPSKEKGQFKSKYSIDLFVDADTDAILRKAGLEPKPEKDSEQKLTDKEFYRFWTHGKNKRTGEVNKPVRVVTLGKERITEELGNGSVVKVQYDALDYDTAGNKGTMGLLKAVQVIELVSRDKDEFEYEEVDSDVKDEFEDDVPF